jgi:peptidyl-prolyl cis-trans isomerase SurA
MIRLLVFSLFASQSVLAAPVVLDRLEASVNSALILLSDVREFRKTVKLRAQLDPLFAGTSLAGKGPSASEKDIVEFLIDDRLILQAFPITDAEVEQEINSIQSNNKIDRASLRRALQEQGFSFDDYFELIRISASKRNLIDRDIRTKVSISDDDVKNFYYNHYAKDTGGNKAYRLQVITVPLADYKSATAAREVAVRALESVKKGEAFEEVARRTVGESANIELGTLTEDQMNQMIREQVKKLQIGGVSPIFGGSQAGAFFILKLADVKSSDSDRFNKVKEEIRSQLAASEYQHQISLWLERQRQIAFIHRAGDPSVAGLAAPASTPSP